MPDDTSTAAGSQTDATAGGQQAGDSTTAGAGTQTAKTSTEGQQQQTQETKTDDVDIHGKGRLLRTL